MPGTSAGQRAGRARYDRNAAHDDTLIIAAVLCALASTAPDRRRDRPARSCGDAALFRPFRAERALCRERGGNPCLFVYALIIAYGQDLRSASGRRAPLSGAVGEPLLVALYSIRRSRSIRNPAHLRARHIGKVAFGALHGILPVALLTMSAIRNTASLYKSRTHITSSNRQTIFSVLFPATLPEVVAGLRIGLTVTLLGVLLAEMFASKRGLGFLIINAMSLAQSEEMLTVALVLFIFAALANSLLLWMEHRLHRRV
jgi:NitT/TauT family transport system permease protein